METLILVGVVFVLGAVAGYAVRERISRRRRARAGGGAQPPGGEDRDALQLLHQSVRRVDGAVERVHEDVKTLVEDLLRVRRQVEEVARRQSAPHPGGGDGPPRREFPPAPAPGRTAPPARDAAGLPPYEPARPLPPPAEPAGPPRDVRDAAEAWLAPPPPAPAPPPPAAAPLPATPPADAVLVEVRDDVVRESTAFPPEAWLVGGPAGTARMTLNPAVGLGEPALRRLRTFYEFEAEIPNVRYETVRAALVRWDEMQRSGRVAQRGSARPLG